MKKPIFPDKMFLNEKGIELFLNHVDNHYIDLNSIPYDKSLFEGYDRIFVVGPQRSGTTFTGQALADTLSFKTVDENDFYVNDLKKFEEVIKQKNIVVQCPGMTHCIQMYSGKKDLTVFMGRKWSDIVKSVLKKNGQISNYVLAFQMYDVEKWNYCKYQNSIKESDFVDIIGTRDDIVDKPYLHIIYKIWKNYQIKNIPNAISLEYESMKSHPMWIDKKDRKNFHEKQTRL